MIELLYFVLAAYGMTQILVYSKILEAIRPTKGWAGELFKCPMCVGFHVGWILMLLSPYTELFNFDVTPVNYLILGCLSSGTSYVLNMLVGDSGFKISKKVEPWDL
tara:strand:- start:754 stop:1071 length:318 start_codon:yes stop_codon:yes gene_type:complete